MLLLFILFIITLFIVWNGYVINWQRAKVDKKADKAKKYSKIWHTTAIVMRFMITAMILYWYWDSTWFFKFQIGFTLLNLFWTVYDLGINIILKQYKPDMSIWQVDTRPWSFNRLLLNQMCGNTKSFWITRFVLIAMNIIVWLP